MMEYIKSINWKNVGWRTIQGFIVLLLNGCGIAIIVMLFLSSETSAFRDFLIESGLFNDEQIKFIMKALNQTINVESMFEAQELTVKAGVIFGEVAGLLMSIGFIKLLYNKKVEDKRAEKQIKTLKEVNNANKFKNL